MIDIQTERGMQAERDIQRDTYKERERPRERKKEVIMQLTAARISRVDIDKKFGFDNFKKTSCFVLPRNKRSK